MLSLTPQQNKQPNHLQTLQQFDQLIQEIDGDKSKKDRTTPESNNQNNQTTNLASKSLSSQPETSPDQLKIHKSNWFSRKLKQLTTKDFSKVSNSLGLDSDKRLNQEHREILKGHRSKNDKNTFDIEEEDPLSIRSPEKIRKPVRRRSLLDLFTSTKSKEIFRSESGNEEKILKRKSSLLTLASSQRSNDEFSQTEVKAQSNSKLSPSLRKTSMDKPLDAVEESTLSPIIPVKKKRPSSLLSFSDFIHRKQPSQELVISGPLNSPNSSESPPTVVKSSSLTNLEESTTPRGITSSNKPKRRSFSSISELLRGNHKEKEIERSSDKVDRLQKRDSFFNLEEVGAIRSVKKSNLRSHEMLSKSPPPRSLETLSLQDRENIMNAFLTYLTNEKVIRTEGLFRLPGEKLKIDRLLEKMIKPKFKGFDPKEDENVIASSLKKFVKSCKFFNDIDNSQDRQVAVVSSFMERSNIDKKQLELILFEMMNAKIQNIEIDPMTILEKKHDIKVLANQMDTNQLSEFISFVEATDLTLSKRVKEVIEYLKKDNLSTAINKISEIFLYQIIDKLEKKQVFIQFINLLKAVESNKQFNKMTAQNLAVCFSPNFDETLNIYFTERMQTILRYLIENQFVFETSTNVNS